MTNQDNKEKTYSYYLMPPARAGEDHPQLTKAEIFDLLAPKHGEGFAQWFIDQLDKKIA
jgi:hypothetical protein